MVLGTLPRVLGSEESVELPVSVFAMENPLMLPPQLREPTSWLN